jgi:hypothetical protein
VTGGTLEFIVLGKRRSDALDGIARYLSPYPAKRLVPPEGTPKRA